MDYLMLSLEDTRLRLVFSADQEGSTGILQSQEMTSVIVVRVIFPNRDVVSTLWNCINALYRDLNDSKMIDQAFFMYLLLVD